MNSVGNVTNKQTVPVNKEPGKPPEQTEQKKETEQVRKNNRVDKLV